MNTVKFAVLSLLLVGCTATEPTLTIPTNAVEFAPPAVFTGWWSTVEECSARTRPMSEVRFFKVLGTATFKLNGVSLLALYVPEANAIVFAENAMGIGPLERHEMLHAIRRDDGYAKHDPTDFGQRCRMYVTPAEYDTTQSPTSGRTNGKTQPR